MLSAPGGDVLRHRAHGRTRRQFEHVSGLKKGQRLKVETVYHFSSVPIDERHGVEYFVASDI